MKLGLQSLTKLFLDVELDKSSSVRCSNWEADVLTSQQVAVTFIPIHSRPFSIFYHMVNLYYLPMSSVSK